MKFWTMSLQTAIRFVIYIRNCDSLVLFYLHLITLSVSRIWSQNLVGFFIFSREKRKRPTKFWDQIQDTEKEMQSYRESHHIK